MIDYEAIQKALRARATNVVTATTGSVALAANANGFTRTTGSFFDDGFRRGMDVLSSGFTKSGNNVRSVITSVSPLDMRVMTFAMSAANGAPVITHPALVIDALANGRSITSGLPFMREWENETTVGLASFVPAAGVPFIEEEFSPSTSRTIGIPLQTARVELTGDYFLRLYGVKGSGKGSFHTILGALYKVFAPGTTIAIGADTLLIQSSPAPVAGALKQTLIGPITTLAIPWLIRSRNSVLA